MCVHRHCFKNPDEGIGFIKLGLRDKMRSQTFAYSTLVLIFGKIGGAFAALNLVVGSLCRAHSARIFRKRVLKKALLKLDEQRREDFRYLLYDLEEDEEERQYRAKKEKDDDDDKREDDDKKEEGEDRDEKKKGGKEDTGNGFEDEDGDGSDSSPIPDLTMSSSDDELNNDDDDGDDKGEEGDTFDVHNWSYM
eukprot:g5844.t1